MKKLGFVDFCIDEWHAENYPAFIEAANKKFGTDYELGYVWAEDDAPAGKLTTDEWCAKHGAVHCASVKELCEKADHVLILSPSNPERHPGLAEKVFECGVSPYIDKTFAPDLETAEKIFALAKKHGVKFFSSSALRYADELSAYNGDARAVSITGGGSNIEEYIIHQIEMAVKCLGKGAGSLVSETIGNGDHITVSYPDGRSAEFLFSPALGFTAKVTGADGKTAEHDINSEYFVNLLGDICNFFDTGKTSFDPKDTIEVMRIRDAVIEGKGKPGESIRLK